MYLITHRDKPLPAEAISEALWPDQDNNNSGNVLKNLIHRLRQKVDQKGTSPKASLIVNIHGCYRFNSEADYWLDVEEFEALCNEARVFMQTDPSKAAELYRKALGLYNGEYLAESPYSDWLMSARHHYRQLFIDSASKLLSLLKDQKDYDLMLMVCEKAFSVEHFEECFHLSYLEALIASGEVSRARAHYEYITALCYQEFGAKPSPALLKLYRTIIKQSEESVASFSDIRELLQERDETEGAMICEPEIFWVLCRMERRRTEREDKPIHVGLFVLESPDYRQLEPGPLLKGMEELKGMLLMSLRKGDVCSFWNKNQFAVLLPGANQEQAGLVLRRVAEQFNDHCLRENLNIKSSIHPLTPFEYV